MLLTRYIGRSIIRKSKIRFVETYKMASNSANKDSSAPLEQDRWSVIPENELKTFIVKCMQKVGTKTEYAEILAELLALADSRGHYSHGLNRLDRYIKDITSGITVANAFPDILKQSGATAWVEGNNALGPTVGKFCIDLAIEKAKDTGVGWVVAKGSNHFGIAGWYAMRAASKGCLGMTFTNASPCLVPTRSRSRGLGTNPICLAANGENDDSFVLDMATTSVAQGKVEVAQRRAEKIPLTWGCDGKGQPTTNPAEVIQDGGCLPLGGTEESGGYKGYGLSMMVEIFCGILAGSEFGPTMRSWRTRDKVANLGQCFVAINPECFAPGFEGRLSSLIHAMKNLDLAEGESEIFVPGDPERIKMKQCQNKGGIPYHPNQIKYMMDLSKEMEIAAPKIIEQK